MSRKTALYERHEKLGGKMVDFAGWLLPVQYESILGEHEHCRGSAVVFDTSHMGQFYFTGPAAGEQLGKLCTQDPAALKVGRCKYGFLLNENGGVLDDTILMRLGGQQYLLVVNAGTLDGDLGWIQHHMSGAAGVELVNRSGAGWGKLDLQGPRSAEVLAPMVDIDLHKLGYFGVTEATCRGRRLVLSRTGYTGELGYEIMAPADDLVRMFDRLMASAIVRPAGLGARDSLRLEMCYPLYGHELNPLRTPIEADLGGFVKLDRDFAGSEALRKQTAAGTRQKLIAFRSDSRRRANPDNAILCEGRPAGTVTSAAFSPSLKVSVGMGYVDAPLAVPGQELTVDTGRVELPVVVSEKPLYTHGTCRASV
jgi:aminomethyltransferase